MNKAVKYTFGVIALYLGVRYASGAGTVINAGSKGGVGFVKALQGR